MLIRKILLKIKTLWCKNRPNYTTQIIPGLLYLLITVLAVLAENTRYRIISVIATIVQQLQLQYILFIQIWSAIRHRVNILRLLTNITILLFKILFVWLNAQQITILINLVHAHLRVLLILTILKLVLKLYFVGLQILVLVIIFWT